MPVLVLEDWEGDERRSHEQEVSVPEAALPTSSKQGSEKSSPAEIRELPSANS